MKNTRNREISGVFLPFYPNFAPLSRLLEQHDNKNDNMITDVIGFLVFVKMLAKAGAGQRLKHIVLAPKFIGGIAVLPSA